MIQVYELAVVEGFEWVLPRRKSDFKVFRSLDGSRRASDWEPVRLMKEDEGESFRDSDFPWLGSHAPVLNQRAQTALEDLLRDDAELLPLDELTPISASSTSFGSLMLSAFQNRRWSG